MKAAILEGWCWITWILNFPRWKYIQEMHGPISSGLDLTQPLKCNWNIYIVASVQLIWTCWVAFYIIENSEPSVWRCDANCRSFWAIWKHIHKWLLCATKLQSIFLSIFFFYFSTQINWLQFQEKHTIIWFSLFFIGFVYFMFENQMRKLKQKTGSKERKTNDSAICWQMF